MGILDGVKRKAVEGEVRRLLHAYRHVLDRFGIRVDDETLVKEVLRLYEAKESHADSK